MGSRTWHFLINGDLKKSNTWEDLSEKMEGKKANLIMERGYAGLDFIPTDLYFQQVVMSRMWDMLDPNGGLMVLQTPPEEVFEARGIPIFSWFEQLTDSGIYNQFGTVENTADGEQSYGVLIMQKNSEAESLPVVQRSLVSIS